MSNVPTDAELQARADRLGAQFVNESRLRSHIKDVDFILHPGTQLTLCVITMLNGFTVTGESACADPKMFDKEVGEKFAFASAEKKMWPLLGYVLKEELFKKDGQTGTFQGRVEAELKELETKIANLEAFVGGETYNSLKQDQTDDLDEQLVSMREYRGVLARRVAKF